MVFQVPTWMQTWNMMAESHLIAMSTVSFPCAVTARDDVLSLRSPITPATFYNTDCSKINNALPIACLDKKIIKNCKNLRKAKLKDNELEAITDRGNESQIG